MWWFTAHSTAMYVPSSELGSPNPSLAMQRVCPSPQNRGVGHTRLRARGWGSPYSDDWRKSLALCLLCDWQAWSTLSMSCLETTWLSSLWPVARWTFSVKNLQKKFSEALIGSHRLKINYKKTRFLLNLRNKTQEWEIQIFQTINQMRMN